MTHYITNEGSLSSPYSLLPSLPHLQDASPAEGFNRKLLTHGIMSITEAVSITGSCSLVCKQIVMLLWGI